MSNLVRTSVLIPEDLLQMAKLKAVKEKTTVSDMIRNVLHDQVHGKNAVAKKKDPMKSLGKFSLGITKIYNKRSDLYDEHIRRKMGL